MMMEPATLDVRLTRALNRFRKNEMLDVIRQLQLFDEQEIRQLHRAIKRAICNFVVDRLRDSADIVDITSKLETLYIKRNETTRQWAMYRLHENKNVTPTAVRLQHLLTDELNLICDADVAVNEFEMEYWIRIAVKDGGKRPTGVASYAVHYTGTSYLGISGIKTKYKEAVLWALGKHLGFSHVVETKLMGRNLHSIFQLADNANHKNEPPSQRRHKFFKRTDPVPEVDTEIQSTLIVDRDKQAKSERNNYIKDVLGGGEPSAELYSLSYNMETPFLGEVKAEEINVKCDNAFHCQLTFEGPSVIAGIQQLVAAGHATPPLPKYISDVQTLGKTHFFIRSVR